MTITDLCTHLNNWFDIGKHHDTFSVKDGSVSLDFLDEGQYFRIVGSKFNDGVHQYPTYELKDEQFDGEIWAMAVPPAVLELFSRMNDYEEQYYKEINSPFQSEQISGFYGYTKNGNLDCLSKFGNELNRWRKI